MPIIELVNDPSTPLSQGDILKGVCLYSTKKSWVNGGGDPEATNRALSLVLSRPCIAMRDDWIVVASIEQYKNKPPAQFSSYEEAIDFFTAIRDGLTTPDQFYLGQITGRDGVFCARFNSLHTIQIPKDGTPERQQFLAASRIAKLNVEFAHDLHLRLFRAFASLGFDDLRWFSTEDLRALVSVASRDDAKLKAELAEHQAKLQVGLSQGSLHESAKKKFDKDVLEVQTKIADLTTRITPYTAEMSRRESAAAPVQEKTP